MSKTKKLLALFMIIGIATMSAPSLKPVKADTDADAGAKNVIYDYVSALNNKDWDKLINLEPGYSSFLKSFVEDKTNQNNKTGILDVESAKLKGILSIPNSEGAKFLSNHSNSYTDLKYFLVATDYDVYNENKYYVNGTNYNLLAVGKLDGQWKIAKGMMAPLEFLHNDGYGFFDKDENSTIQITQQLKQGKIVNKSGKILGYDSTPSNFKNTINNIVNANLQLSSISPYNFNLPFPATICVHLHDAGYNIIVYTNRYVKDVLPNEWYASWPYASLEAGAMAVKEYAWFHHYSPTSNGMATSSDLDDTPEDQRYIMDSHLNSVNATSNQACDAVYKWGLVNSSGNVFATEYAAYSMSGRMSQPGSKDLANKGYSFMQILQYYYGNVTKQYIGDIPQY